MCLLTRFRLQFHTFIFLYPLNLHYPLSYETVVTAVNTFQEIKGLVVAHLMIDLFDHLSEYSVFSLRVLPEGLQNSVVVISHRDITSLCLFSVKAVDIAEKHTEVVGMVFPVILCRPVAFFVYLAHAIHVVILFFKSKKRIIIIKKTIKKNIIL